MLFHIKRYLSEKHTISLYIAMLVLVIAIQFNFIDLMTQSNAFNIAVYAPKNTAQSEHFIHSIASHSLIEVIRVTSDDAGMLLDGSVDALLVLPEGDILKSPLQLHYIHTNVKVPAIVDIGKKLPMANDNGIILLNLFIIYHSLLLQ